MNKIIFLFVVAILLGCTTAEQEQKLPNILFAIADDASYPHMGAYGTDWIVTPAFDYIAENGLLFERAYTTNAKCAPSRATILTGRNSWQLEEACNHWPTWPEKFKSFAEVLPKASYTVGHTAKGWAPGKAFLDSKPRALIGPAFNTHKIEPPAKYISDNDYSANFAAFLDQVPAEDPWFFWYGAIEPHRAYEYGVGQRIGNKSLDQIDVVPPFWPDNDTVRMDLLDYAFEIEYFDQHLMLMLEELRRRDLLDQTLIVVTADNGMPFPRVKGQVYEMDNHLPLAMMWPEGINSPGRSIDQLVSFSDFAPTFLEIAGVDISQSGMAPITGKSLTGIFSNESSGTPLHDFILIGKERHDVGRPNDWGYPVRGIIKGEYLYTMNFETSRWPAGNPETGYLNTDGSPTKTTVLDYMRSNKSKDYWDWAFGLRPEEELYHIIEDPYCIINLADKPELLETKENLQELMLTTLKKQGDPRALGMGEIFDQYEYADPKTKDFYNRWVSGEELKAGWVNPDDFERNMEKLID